MRCSGCAAENAPDCRFCSECGARLVSICPSCRFENAPAAKFCGGCGARLTGAAAPAVTQPAPESYTPKPLAERILRSRGALEGERKQVTVLFADIKGSMELIQSADPEDARRILDPTIEAMMRAVHRYEGTVNKVLGDGIMALFGAPIAHEDHAVRACYAALAIQNALREIAEKIRRDFGVEVQVRTGLHSGEVVVRTIGNDLTMDYDAIGQTTHLASRMEQLALPGSIRMTADTLRLAEGLVQVRPLGPIPVKGLVQPIEVFELIGAAAVRSACKLLRSPASLVSSAASARCTRSCASPTSPAATPLPPRNFIRASSPRSAAPNATPSPRFATTWQSSGPKGSLPSFPAPAATNCCRAVTQSV